MSNITEKFSNKTTFNLLAIIIALGLMAAAFILGQQFKNLREPGVISVKGLAEAHYQATLGTWQVGVQKWGQDYGTARTNALNDLKILKSFLSKQGFTESAIQSENVDIQSHTEYYNDENGERQSRENGYDATIKLVVLTKDLVRLQKALNDIQDLRANNESITFEAPKYYLENLENIKRDLIAKATKDAAVRAEEFAKTGNVKVGVMKSASQGSFNIQSPNPSDESGSDYGGSYDTTTIEKNVRLVVTIEYRIN